MDTKKVHTIIEGLNFKDLDDAVINILIRPAHSLEELVHCKDMLIAGGELKYGMITGFEYNIAKRRLFKDSKELMTAIMDAYTNHTFLVCTDLRDREILGCFAYTSNDAGESNSLLLAGTSISHGTPHLTDHAILLYLTNTKKKKD